MVKTPELSIVVPVYGQFDLARAYISVQSILSQRGIDYEVIVSEQGEFPRFSEIHGVRHVFKCHKPKPDLSDFNPGNVRNTQIVKDPVSLWMLPLIRSEGKSVKEDGQRYLAWEVALNPNESVNIPVIINYRILVYLAIALLLFALFYFYAQSPLSLTKTATTVHGEEGTLSEIKITLELRNYSKKPIKNVTVIDLVPSIANVDKSLELGTLKPHETKQTKEGTKVAWSLAELDAHEQRLITYKIKAKLNILGTFSLPRASTEFERKKGQRRKAYSNIFRIGE